MPAPVPAAALSAALSAQEPGAPAADGDLLGRLARAVAGSAAPDRGALRTAVRALALELAARAPGRTVEVRVPPYAAVQCVEGPRHTRGTPPNVVEAEPLAFVRLCTGALSWEDAVADGRLRASGERAGAVAALLPLVSRSTT